MQAWRGKERSMAALHGTFEEGYRLLPAYCEQVRKTNPGSIATVVATGQENCFQRLFISYRASIYGFINACRPLLEFDKAHLKGKYLGSLLCAAAVDADDTLFPLAIAIVDVESDENWMCFMSELQKLLGVNTDNMPRLTILSERQRGIVEAVETHFPSAFQAVEFESKIAEMVEVSQEVIPWFQQFPPQLWAVAYFEGVRYGHFTLGVTELLYNWALELPSAEKRILEAIADARCYQVLRANEVEFEIVSTERTNIVDIQSRVCSCRCWQLYGLPCAHAAAALISYKSQWRELGEGAEGGGAKVDITIRPPKTRRPPGRPKKKVLRVENLKGPKRVVQCGRCHMLGHSQKKCTMPI
uniref:SWIM-type domain-containing protein n=1 Tax=Fagus sylvatica TaxID=28930 RepID=A0A2N9H220_FAGSY